MSDTWREGARVRDPLDRCPQCNGPAIFASDFRKLGKHQVRACEACKAVFDNGKQVSDLAVT